MIGNDPINDPENFDWETWEDDQIAGHERKERALETIRVRTSWRGINEKGRLFGYYSAGGQKHLLEIENPRRTSDIEHNRYRLFVNGEKIGTAKELRQAKEIITNSIFNRSPLFRPAESHRDPDQPRPARRRAR